MKIKKASVITLLGGLLILTPCNKGFCGNSEGGLFRIIFYNVENLFDTINEPGKRDDAFTPDGDRGWTFYRLDNKLRNIYRALAAAGGLGGSSFIGLCEVENSYVLELLISRTGFKDSGYEIIHRNSPDNRGIDVAALYRPDCFTIIDTVFIVVEFPFDSLAATRDILYVKGYTARSDTLHLFVNHWMSRWGGEAATEPYRKHTAALLKEVTDSIMRADSRSGIVVMGDFNDNPDNKSLVTHLKAQAEYSDSCLQTLYNLSFNQMGQGTGTLKFRGEWFIFDQFIVSGNLLSGDAGLQTCYKSASIFSAPFLLTPDINWFGYKPFRTYEGFRHSGGFSDHLPIVLDLWWQSD